MAFYEARRDLLRTRIRRAFGLDASTDRSTRDVAAVETIPPLDESIEAAGIDVLDE